MVPKKRAGSPIKSSKLRFEAIKQDIPTTRKSSRNKQPGKALISKTKIDKENVEEQVENNISEDAPLRRTRATIRNKRDGIQLDTRLKRTIVSSNESTAPVGPVKRGKKGYIEAIDHRNTEIEILNDSEPSKKVLTLKIEEEPARTTLKRTRVELKSSRGNNNNFDIHARPKRGKYKQPEMVNNTEKSISLNLPEKEKEAQTSQAIEESEELVKISKKGKKSEHEEADKEINSVVVSMGNSTNDPTLKIDNADSILEDENISSGIKASTTVMNPVFPKRGRVGNRDDKSTTNTESDVIQTMKTRRGKKIITIPDVIIGAKEKEIKSRKSPRRTKKEQDIADSTVFNVSTVQNENSSLLIQGMDLQGKSQIKNILFSKENIVPQVDITLDPMTHFFETSSDASLFQNATPPPAKEVLSETSSAAVIPIAIKCDKKRSSIRELRVPKLNTFVSTFGLNEQDLVKSPEFKPPLRKDRIVFTKVSNVSASLHDIPRTDLSNTVVHESLSQRRPAESAIDSKSEIITSSIDLLKKELTSLNAQRALVKPLQIQGTVPEIPSKFLAAESGIDNKQSTTEFSANRNVPRVEPSFEKDAERKEPCRSIIASSPVIEDKNQDSLSIANDFLEDVNHSMFSIDSDCAEHFDDDQYKEKEATVLDIVPETPFSEKRNSLVHAIAQEGITGPSLWPVNNKITPEDKKSKKDPMISKQKSDLFLNETEDSKRIDILKKKQDEKVNLADIQLQRKKNELEEKQKLEETQQLEAKRAKLNLNSAPSICVEKNKINAPVNSIFKAPLVKNPILGSIFHTSPTIDYVPHGKHSVNSIGMGPTSILSNGEFPDIPSDYSDTDEEIDQQDKKKNNIPLWAHTPNLMKALHDQYQRDPDAIFGHIKPCSLEDIFKGVADMRKLRVRSSSANWSGTDKLSTAEINHYQKKMGFKK